ncbi:hypothetical protein GOBAR_AA35695 [Gossypium barbadense]|uniref:Piwi domain-containing protein n=1 Tax=Gossypium barbadense TaxID=3634 RepID=A0A2P5W1Q3_GOSBA|nr:hypothetical protein GOBAR_AA35695 [Gossypium barbadense]
MLTLGQTPSIPVVSKVPTIILGMGALFGFPKQSDVPSIAAMILSSKPVSDKVDDGIMKEALLDFYTSSGKRKHDQVIIFRDGGSPDNMLPGTVIDHKICRPKNNDYYLCAHARIIETEYHSHISYGRYLLRSFDSFTIRAIYEVCGCFRDIIKPWWSDCTRSTLDTSAFQVEG